jgi:hypothetical protein
MFGMSMRERAVEALHRGTKAVLIGGYFHIDHSKQFGLNEEASAWLYTEAISQQIYALTVIANNTISKNYRWATPELVIKTINEIITDFEIKERLTPGSISSFVFRRCAEIDQLTPQQRADGEQFWQSARKIRKLDQRANEPEIVEKLASTTQEYFHTALKMFN